MSARVVDTPVLSLTGRLFREGSTWVAHCPEFDVATHDSSAEGARTALREAVAAFLESCVSRRTLRGVLRERGLPAIRPRRIGRRAVQLPVHISFVHGEQFSVRLTA